MPIRSRDRVLGVLDVLSDTAGALIDRLSAVAATEPVRAIPSNIFSIVLPKLETGSERLQAIEVKNPVSKKTASLIFLLRSISSILLDRAFFV